MKDNIDETGLYWKQVPKFTSAIEEPAGINDYKG